MHASRYTRLLLLTCPGSHWPAAEGAKLVGQAAAIGGRVDIRPILASLEGADYERAVLAHLGPFRLRAAERLVGRLLRRLVRSLLANPVPGYRDGRVHKAAARRALARRLLLPLIRR